MLDEKIARQAARRLFRKFHFQGDYLNNYELSSMLQSTYQILNERTIGLMQPSNRPIKILPCISKSQMLTKMAKSASKILNRSRLVLLFNSNPKTCTRTRTHTLEAGHTQKAISRTTVNHTHPYIPKINHSKKAPINIPTPIYSKTGTSILAIITLNQDSASKIRTNFTPKINMKGLTHKRFANIWQ